MLEATCKSNKCEIEKKLRIRVEGEIDKPIGKLMEGDGGGWGESKAGKE